MRAANLVLRFLLELAALAAVAWWGAQVSGSTAVNVVVAIAAPLAVATVWGTWLAPKAQRRLEPPARHLLELVVLAAAVAALVAVGATALAVAYALVAIANALLMRAWHQ